MVDPMFKIVENLMLFLTAVAPTAVTPTKVILLKKKLKSIWTIMEHFEQLLYHFDYFLGLLWIVLDNIGLF